MSMDKEQSGEVPLHPNEMRWRFDYEDDADARLVISRYRKFDSAGHEGARVLLREVIEDWADNEPGMWDRDGTNFKVVVLEPKNMAGHWNVRVWASACAAAERFAPSTNSDEDGL